MAPLHQDGQALAVLLCIPGRYEIYPSPDHLWVLSRLDQAVHSIDLAQDNLGWRPQVTGGEVQQGYQRGLAIDRIQGLGE